MTHDPHAAPDAPARRKPPLADSKKREHAAFMLPVAGFLLIVPPLLTLFGGHHFLFGVPLRTMYFFAVWLAMIVGAALLSHYMPAAGTDEHEGAAEDGP